MTENRSQQFSPRRERNVVLEHLYNVQPAGLLCVRSSGYQGHRDPKIVTGWQRSRSPVPSPPNIGLQVAVAWLTKASLKNIVRFSVGGGVCGEGLRRIYAKQFGSRVCTRHSMVALCESGEVVFEMASFFLFLIKDFRAAG